MKKLLFTLLTFASLASAHGFDYFNREFTFAPHLGYGGDFNGNRDKVMDASQLGITVYENREGNGLYFDLSYIGFEEGDISGYESGHVDIDEDIVTLVVGRNHFWENQFYLAPRVGLAYLYRDIDGKKYKDKRTRVTPLIGFSIERNLNDKWFARATTDLLIVSGAASSELCVVSVGYKF